MIIDKPYLEDYFCNIITETWLFKSSSENFLNFNSRLPPRLGKFTFNDPVQKGAITFKVEHLEVLIFDEKFKNEHYLMGKCPSYFFLSIRKDEEEYPWVSIVKNSTLAPLVNKVTHFKEMFPYVKAGEFASKLLLNNKLNDNLAEKVSEQKKISKI
jgi:hypothetical protein